MKKKKFSNVTLILIGVILFGTVGYITWVKKSTPITIESNSTQRQNSESEVIANLKANWKSVQALVPFRPSYHNQEENRKGMWRTPYIVQFIGKNNILSEIEDDNNPHVVILHYDGDKFSLLESFKNQYNFTLSDYQNLLNKYGDSSYNVSTYTIGLVRDGKIAFFQDLTKVPENIFVKGYSAKKNF